MVDRFDLLEASSPIVVEVLKNALELEIKWGDDSDDIDRIKAYKTVLKDFMLNKDYNLYLDSL